MAVHDLCVGAFLFLMAVCDHVHAVVLWQYVCCTCHCPMPVYASMSLSCGSMCVARVTVLCQYVQACLFYGSVCVSMSPSYGSVCVSMSLSYSSVCEHVTVLWQCVCEHVTVIWQCV